MIALRTHLKHPGEIFRRHRCKLSGRNFRSRYLCEHLQIPDDFEILETRYSLRINNVKIVRRSLVNQKIYAIHILDVVNLENAGVFRADSEIEVWQIVVGLLGVRCRY